VQRTPSALQALKIVLPHPSSSVARVLVTWPLLANATAIPRQSRHVSVDVGGLKSFAKLREPFTLLPSQRGISGSASTAVVVVAVVVAVGVAVGLAADVVNQVGPGLGLAAGVVKHLALTECRTPKRMWTTALTVSHSAPVKP
jgi:hypothetical protein